MEITWEVIRRNWGVIVVILTWLLTMIVFVITLQGRIFDTPIQKYDTIKHVYDDDIHMPYEEKVKNFVTRPEYEATIKQLHDQMKTLNKNVDDIKTFLMKK